MNGQVMVEFEGKVTAVARKAAQIVERRISQKSEEARRYFQKPVRLILSLKPGAGKEGFRIFDSSAGSIVIEGHDERGLVYGVGKFLRNSELKQGKFIPSAWRGTMRPEKPVRGIYFATHFHNFYHDAPVSSLQEYVEDLALWGCNCLSVWFDMHHYNGIEDPEAMRMIERLRAVLEAARSVGMGCALTTLANEGYANSPEELRADWTAGHDGYHTPPGAHYHVELCPAKPGAIELEVRWRREILEVFGGIPLDFIWLWPYDQGGCTCAQCAPWGVNGFLKISEAVARMIRKTRAEAKIVLSTWDFDRFISGEWDGLAKKFTMGAPDWIDYLMADDFSKGIPEYVMKHGAPGNLPLLNFPEISMEGMWPWGGFGANPRPVHWQSYWDKFGSLVAGGFPYSEGIFEDINKVLHLQFGWSPSRKASDIVEEYAQAYFGAEIASDVLRAVFAMERQMPVSVSVDKTKSGRDAVRYKTNIACSASQTAASLREAESKIDVQAARSWRWRILKLRAELDAEVERNEGAPNEATERALEELNGIYYAEDAEYAVSCPSLRKLSELNDW